MAEPPDNVGLFAVISVAAFIAGGTLWYNWPDPPERLDASEIVERVALWEECKRNPPEEYDGPDLLRQHEALRHSIRCMSGIAPYRSFEAKRY